MRFYKATGIRLTPELIRELLTEEIWRLRTLLQGGIEVEAPVLHMTCRQSE